MSGLVFGCIAPHGGMLIPDIAGREGRKAQATRAAMEGLGRRMAATQPETSGLVTPHGIPVERTFSLLDSSQVAGELGGGGCSVAVEFQVDNALNAAIAEAARTLRVPVARVVQGRSREP